MTLGEFMSEMTRLGIRLRAEGGGSRSPPRRAC